MTFDQNQELYELRHKIVTLRVDRDLLRAALVKLVGVDGREELEQLEAMMRLMAAPAEDKAATIDAIQALLRTMGEPASTDAVDPVPASSVDPTTREKTS